jgi:hypothetical protein
MRLVPIIAVLAACAVMAVAAPPAAAAPSVSKVTGTICSMGGLISGVIGKICTVATHAGRVLSAGKKLASGHLGSALGALTGDGASTVVSRAAGMAAIVVAVVGGARYALDATVTVIGATTRPDLTSTWFSASYWRMAAIAALLTLPFLFAAAIQAIIRSDLALLARAALGYLPLAMFAIAVAAPVTMLLLAGSDEMSAIVASASGQDGSAFLDHAGALVGLLSASGATLFIAFFVGLVTIAAALTLWVELLVRDAAVYVIVLMLPLFFAALVWPARRIWAMRAVELLVALILSKFVIVAVLALGGAALGHTTFPGAADVLAGATLVLLAAFSPWALIRLLPLHEVAGAAMSGLSSPLHRLGSAGARADTGTDHAEQAADVLAARVRDHAAGPPPAPEHPIGDVPTLPPGDEGDGADPATPGGRPAPDPDGGSPSGAGTTSSPLLGPPAPGETPAPGHTATPGDTATLGETPAAGEPPGTVGAADPGPPAPAADDGPRSSSAAVDPRRAHLPPPFDRPDFQLHYGLDEHGRGAIGPASGTPADGPEVDERPRLDGPVAERSEPDSSGEDHDPRPPAQDPEGGRL